MGYIHINQGKVTGEIAAELTRICPFDAFEYTKGILSINAACKMCRLCVKKGPFGVCEFREEPVQKIDKTKYRGIAVYIENNKGVAHPVAWELVGKARELSKKTGEPVYALLIGDKLQTLAEAAIAYGADKVFVYEDEAFGNFNVEIHTNVVEAFNKRHHPNIILFGGTAQGRSFAPRVAARLKTGLTADCTALDIRPDGDLLQIRPAFGGNIMAKIHTPNHRPQLATIRYKIFSAPELTEGAGQIIREDTANIETTTNLNLVAVRDKPKTLDISDSEVIVAVGRAFKKQKDLELIRPLVERLHAEVACTRPLVENGWFDPRRQIGLSGRTVKPKLIITLGISGAIQFVEGMKDSDLIISVNQDPACKLFQISHYAIVGDIYEVLPELNRLLDQIL